MEIENLIGFPKDEVIEILTENKIDFDVKFIGDLKNFDTQLLVKFEYIKNKLTLYFDNFILNV